MNKQLEQKPMGEKLTDEKSKGEKPNERRTQAERLLSKFGGARRLAELFFIVGAGNRNPSGIYRWAYPKARGGTGGLIPTNAWPWIFKAADLEGFQITAKDLDPRCLENLDENLEEIFE